MTYRVHQAESTDITDIPAVLKALGLASNMTIMIDDMIRGIYYNETNQYDRIIEQLYAVASKIQSESDTLDILDLTVKMIQLNPWRNGRRPNLSMADSAIVSNGADTIMIAYYSEYDYSIINQIDAKQPYNNWTEFRTLHYIVAATSEKAMNMLTILKLALD